MEYFVIISEKYAKLFKKVDGKNIIKIKYNDECNNSHKNVLLTNIKQIEPFIYHIKIINKWKMEVTFVVECILLEVTSIEIYHLFGWLQFHSVSLMDFHFFQFSLLRRTYNIPFPMNDNYLALFAMSPRNIFGFQFLSQM